MRKILLHKDIQTHKVTNFSLFFTIKKPQILTRTRILYAKSVFYTTNAGGSIASHQMR